MPRLVISEELIRSAMQAAPVREAIAARADGAADRARQIARAEDVEMTVTRKDGTRPKGRPFARVESDNVKQEWGTSIVARRRVLGRSAGGS